MLQQVVHSRHIKSINSTNCPKNKKKKSFLYFIFHFLNSESNVPVQGSCTQLVLLRYIVIASQLDQSLTQFNVPVQGPCTVYESESLNTHHSRIQRTSARIVHIAITFKVYSHSQAVRHTHHFRIKRSSARIVHRLESIKPESSRSKSELESIKPESSRSKQSFMVYHHFSTIHLHSNIYFLEISLNFKHVRLALQHVYHT